MTIFGADVSYYQDNTSEKLDWSKVTDIGFMLARASIGADADATYGYHIAGAAKQGILQGAYHFLEPGDGAKQADTFLSAVGDPTGKLMALDVELMGILYSTVAAFYARFHARVGAHPLLTYGPKGVLRKVFSGQKMLGPLWLAWYPLPAVYGGDADPTWDFAVSGTTPLLWQYGSRKEAGLSIDSDAYRGTIAQLTAYAAGQSSDPNAPGGDMTVPVSNDADVLIDLPKGKQLYDLNGNPLTVIDGAAISNPADPSTWIVSPYEVAQNGNHYRVVSVTSSHVRQLAMIHNPDANIRPVPAAVDTTPYSQADLDAASAAGKTAGKSVGFEDAISQMSAVVVTLQPKV